MSTSTKKVNVFTHETIFSETRLSNIIKIYMIYLTNISSQQYRINFMANNVLNDLIHEILTTSIVDSYVEFIHS